ncbi:MAG: hypothetical protein ACTSXG_02210 [Alphaproteobacteria bacterium]
MAVLVCVPVCSWGMEDGVAGSDSSNIHLVPMVPNVVWSIGEGSFIDYDFLDINGDTVEIRTNAPFLRARNILIRAENLIIRTGGGGIQFDGSQLNVNNIVVNP